MTVAQFALVIAWAAAGIVDCGFWNAWSSWRWPEIERRTPNWRRALTIPIYMAIGPAGLYGSWFAAGGELFEHGWKIFP